MAGQKQGVRWLPDRGGCRCRRLRIGVGCHQRHQPDAAGFGAGDERPAAVRWPKRFGGKVVNVQTSREKPA